MHILLLGARAEQLIPTIESNGDTWSLVTTPLVNEEADWIVSFGYPHILREPHLSRFASRMINIHISILPWNRGTDSNFWSWFDSTPKGVSIHFIEAGIHTGKVLTQAAVEFPLSHTLRTSYETLMSAGQDLFSSVWPSIKRGNHAPMETEGGGTYHRRGDKERLWSQLQMGYDTPVEEVEEFGAECALAADFWSRYDAEIEAMRHEREKANGS